MFQIQWAHCKSFLLYGMETVDLSNRELNTLNYTYSNAIFKLFKVSHCSVENILHFTQEPSISRDCWVSRNKQKTLLLILCVSILTL